VREAETAEKGGKMPREKTMHTEVTAREKESIALSLQTFWFAFGGFIVSASFLGLI
jgi:hypothetical protein